MELTQSQLREIWKHVSEGYGGYCPVCDRWGKVYARTLNGNLVRALGWIYKEQQRTKEEWVDVPSVAPRSVMRGYDFTILKYWDFIKQKPLIKKIKGMPPQEGERTGVRTSGMWSITPHGRMFVTNQMAVPYRVFIYADAARGFSKETVYAKEVMDKKFDYDAMMQDIYEDLKNS